MRTFSFLVLCLMGFFFVACDEDEDRLGDWAKGATFPGEPRNQAVTFQIGDYVYVGLGIGVNGAEYKNFYKYNLKTGIWDNTQPVTDFKGEARHAAVAFVLDGKAYVGLGFRVGRYYSDETVNRKYFYDFWEYDPTKEGTQEGPWSEIAPFPGHDKVSEDNELANDGGGRRDAIAFTIEGDNYGYVGLGRGYNDMVYNEIYSYNPTTGWSAAPIPFNGEARYDVEASVAGGGFTGQAEAVRLGIARALLEAGEDRKTLKVAGMLTRNAKSKERKKYGLKGARRAPQFSKR